MADKLKLDPLNKPIMADEAKAISAEISQDGEAARVRDYGPDDAATYPARVEAGAEMATRETLLAETYTLAREIGFIGFRREFMNDQEAIEEWATPTEREEGLRDFWNEQADFESYRQSHADVEIDVLARYRDELVAFLSAPKEVQEEYYGRIAKLGRSEREALAANDNTPGGDEPTHRHDDLSPIAEFAAMMDDIAVPPRFDERFEVWHADRYVDPGEPSLDFPAGYSREAEVLADSLGQAVELTTHIDGPWQENARVEVADGYRSTFIGDVIVDPQGQAHRFEEQGFHPIARDASDYKQQVREAAERGKFRQEDKDRSR